MIPHEEYWRQFLDPDMVKHCSITDFKGMTIGINSTNWLVKALLASMEGLIDNHFKDYMFYVDQILSKVRNFRIAGVEPVMVFEGRQNLLKTEAQIKREESRQLLLDQGYRLLEYSKSTHEPNCKQKLRQEAISSLQKGLKPSPEMVCNVIAALKQVGVTVIVAPCEVDAQLVHLCISGVCQAILSENFDVIAYSLISGHSFPLIFKFEHTGATQVVSLKSLQLMPPKSKNLVDIPHSAGLKRQLSIQSIQSTPSLNISVALKDYILEYEGVRLFLHFLLLAGCIFVESVREMNLSLAFEIVFHFHDIPSDSRLVQIVKYLQVQEFDVPVGYLERLLRAEAIYYYHPVYDPIEKNIKPFVPPNIFSVPCSETISRDDSRPLIHQPDLTKLTVDMVLLEKAPDDVAISDICEGSVSVYSYAPIIPSFPWDLPDLRPSPESMGTKDSRFNHGVWGIRASLMRCLSPSLSSSPSSQSQSSQDSPLSTSYNFPSQVPTLNIFSAPAMDTPRRLQKRKLVSTRTSIPQAIDPCFAHEGDDQTPKSPPDNKQGFQSTEEDFHSPPNSHSTSRNVGPSLTETISPPSDRPSHDKANDSISPDIDRLVCLLDEEDELEKTKERSPEHNLRKKPRTSGEIVTLSLRKGKKEKQKTMTVASIKSYFR